MMVAYSENEQTAWAFNVDKTDGRLWCELCPWKVRRCLLMEWNERMNEKIMKLALVRA